MGKTISPDKLKKAENQAVEIMERIWVQTNNKKNLARIITFAVLAIAVFQEFYLKDGLSNNWKEITIHLLIGYFGMSTYRCIFKP